MKKNKKVVAPQGQGTVKTPADATKTEEKKA